MERVDWEDFPEIGEHDWEIALAKGAAPPMWEWAHKLLAERARDSEHHRLGGGQFVPVEGE